MQIKKDRNRNKSNLGDTALLHCENSMVQVGSYGTEKTESFDSVYLAGMLPVC